MNIDNVKMNKQEATQKIESLIKSEVEEHFKCKGVTPTLYFTWIFPWWKTTWKQGNIQSSNQTSKK